MTLFLFRFFLKKMKEKQHHNEDKGNKGKQ